MTQEKLQEYKDNYEKLPARVKKRINDMINSPRPEVVDRFIAEIRKLIAKTITNNKK